MLRNPWLVYLFGGEKLLGLSADLGRGFGDGTETGGDLISRDDFFCDLTQTSNFFLFGSDHTDNSQALNVETSAKWGKEQLSFSKALRLNVLMTCIESFSVPP